MELEEARQRVLDSLAPLQTESVALAMAGRRILAESIAAPVPLPPFDNSAMDGYAVRASETVLVDRGRLTARQREVLETAVEMGYFEYPKGANAGEVAEALDISVSTYAEHVAAAQTKVFDDLLDCGGEE
jgi:molybdopterin biosynthesis enzyme